MEKQMEERKENLRDERKEKRGNERVEHCVFW